MAGGLEVTDVDLLDWARRVEELGAGEILLTSVNRDGVTSGYDIEQLRAVADAVTIPVVASGGAGSLEDFYLALTEGRADAALGASVFHFGTFTVGQVKAYLAERGVDVRL
ncbi:MAG: Imidazole glycerol phosphate synthase subunit HisF [Firmicutes bacterium ADurb.Bin506]|nr:MAG: Imidazole glycerol phosphate synthase subunit HisF [Firmicutes bacterium ADurb.Bin506]